MGLLNGVIVNRSTEALWVIETDTGPAIAHKLNSQLRSPSGLDADGVRTVSGKHITNHPSDLGTPGWWKISSIETGILTDGTMPNLFIMIDAGIRVPDNEFGPVQYDEATGWGEAI